MPSPPTFLRLPREIRLKIYVFAGLVRLCPINLNDEGSRKTYRDKQIGRYLQSLMPWERPNLERARDIYCDYRKKIFLWGYRCGTTAMMECICPSLPIHLLTVCRTLYQEVFEILYSRNKFKYYIKDDIQLNWEGVRIMTSLCIRLNTCSCVPGHFCDHPRSDIPSERCKVCHSTCRRGRDPPLSANSPDAKEVVEKWVAFSGILVKNLRPEMRLTVISDCADLESAQKVVDSLKVFPTLSQYSVRLGQSPSMPWRKVAEDVVYKLMNRQTLGTFQYLNLPMELQRHILIFTDLVSPYILEVGDFLPGTRQRGIGPFRQGDRVCCFRCTDSAEACCCVVNHAAFSSIQCHCWVFPKALFYVSKGMRQEAINTFFSKNKFLITEQIRSYSGDHSSGEGSGMGKALTFFRRILPYGTYNGS
ncbi:hypothetical protein CVT26_015258 [Gymnopilus dilepis]|uniref:F-box domain-containing protein n=1 Tax=Gymnopilus dilepis TaxID=231916 RepID=A0A409X073_9AGAR|nr:hypothetical protein CVT26_015258 [Gymnopilus dilepis]